MFMQRTLPMRAVAGVGGYKESKLYSLICMCSDDSAFNGKIPTFVHICQCISIGI